MSKRSVTWSLFQNHSLIGDPHYLSRFLLTPFNVHEILGFEILSSKKHFWHWEISEILLRVKRFRPVLAVSATAIRLESWAVLNYAWKGFGRVGYFRNQRAYSHALDCVESSKVFHRIRFCWNETNFYVHNSNHHHCNRPKTKTS